MKVYSETYCPFHILSHDFFAAKFHRLIRIQKKYTDNFKNRGFSQLRQCFGVRNLAKNLRFYVKYHVVMDDLADRPGVGKATLYNWFKSDDCFLSYVYAIAMAEDMKLDISISPL